MATKIKPIRLNVTGTPSAGQVPKFVDDQTFERGENGGLSSGLMAYDTTGNGYSYDIIVSSLLSLQDNVLITARFNVTNLAGATLNVNDFGAKIMKTVDGDMLSNSQLNILDTYIIRYEQTDDCFYIARFSSLQNNVTSSFINLTAFDSLLTTLSVGSDYCALDIDYVNNIIYTSSRQGNRVYKLDLNLGVIQYITTNNGNDGILIIGNTLWLGNETGTSELRKIDLNNFSNGVIGTYSIGGNHLDGLTNIGNIIYGIKDDSGNSIFRFDTTTNTITHQSSAGRGIGIISVGNRLFCSCQSNGNNPNKVLELNPDDLSILQSSPTLSAVGPRRMCYDNGYIYVSSQQSNYRQKLDATDLSVVATIDVGGIGDSVSIIENFVYFDSGGQLKRVNKNNFQTSLVTNTQNIGATAYQMKSLGSILYISTTNSEIKRIPIVNIGLPEPGTYNLYFKTDGKLYRMDSNGNEQLIGTQS